MVLVPIINYRQDPALNCAFLIVSPPRTFSFQIAAAGQYMRVFQIGDGAEAVSQQDSHGPGWITSTVTDVVVDALDSKVQAREIRRPG